MSFHNSCQTEAHKPAFTRAMRDKRNEPNKRIEKQRLVELTERIISTLWHH